MLYGNLCITVAAQQKYIVFNLPSVTSGTDIAGLSTGNIKQHTTMYMTYGG